MFRRIGASITTFRGSASGASSIAHDLIDLWLSRVLDPDDSVLASAYDRLSIIFSSRPLWDVHMQVGAVKLVLDFLQLDTARLPATTVIRYLKAAIEVSGQDDTMLNLILEGALSALRAEPAEDNERDVLTQIVADVLSAMRRNSMPTALLAWLTLHRAGTEYVHLFSEDPRSFMEKVAHSQIPETHPDLFNQACSMMRARYRGFG